MATPEQQLLSSMNPQMARLLDEQMAGQRAAQGVDPGYGGIVSSAVQGATMLGNLGRDALGLQRQKGANEQTAIQQRAQLKEQIAKQKAEKESLIESRKVTAEQILQNNPGIPEAKARAMMTTIRADISGAFADQVIAQYGTPEIQDKFKVAGNRVFNTETEAFMTPPTDAKEVTVTLEKATGLKLNDYSLESQKAAVDIMLDTTLPLGTRIKQAKDVLQAPDSPAVSERRLDNLVNTIEEADIPGVLAKFNVITQQGDLLNRGITTGFGAEALTTIASIGKQLGVLSDEQADTLANTQNFTANAGNLVAQVIKAFGAGTGLSDADRQYAATIAAADITKGELSLRRILDMQARNTIAQIETYNKNIRSLMKSDASWGDELKEVPRLRRLDMDAVKRQPNSKIQIPGTDEYYWVDNADDGYKGEVYDSEGYRLPFAKLDPAK